MRLPISPRLAAVVLALLSGGAAGASAVEAGVDSVPVSAPAPRELLVELDVPRAFGPNAVASARTRFANAFGARGRILSTYDHLPYVVVETGTLDTTSLAHLPGVRRAFVPQTYRPLLTESLPFVGQPEAVRRGATGRGTTVVVIDTGADWTTPDLGSCTAPGTPGCRVVHAQDFGGDDGLRDVSIRHGTSVASTVARMAPEAGVIVLDPFLPGSVEVSEPTVLEALDWTLAHQHDAAFGEQGIVAVNLSLGGGNYATTCNETAFATAIGALRQAGISVVAASGNDGWKDSMDAPACVPGVLSVGNVYDSAVADRDFQVCQDKGIGPDSINCLSNASAVLALLAPGADITAGGVTLMGTSMASPHVAGAVALLRSLHPDDPVDTLESRLTASGRHVVDARNGLDFPRLDVASALDAEPDTAGPTGTVSFEKVWFSGTALTQAFFAAHDASGTLQMCVSVGDTQCEWTLYQRTLGLILNQQEEPLPVYVWFADRWNNMAGPFSTVVGFDSVAPVDGTVTAVAQGRSAVLSFSGASDAKSGLARLVVVEDAAGTDVGCNGTAMVGTLGDDNRYTIPGLAPGSRHTYRLCLIDGAGNRSPGVPASVTIDPNAPADEAGEAVSDAGSAGDTGCGCANGATDLLGLVAAGAGLVGRRRKSGRG